MAATTSAPTTSPTPARQRRPRALGRVLGGLKFVWLLLGIVLLLLLAANWVVGVLVDSWQRRSLEVDGKYIVDGRAGAFADPRASAADARQLVTELGEASGQGTTWRPFVYWRLRPFQGRFVNVDDEGLRATVKPPGVVMSPNPRRVFLFGGSTMWSANVPDALAIPSCLWKQMSRPGDWEMTNFGQPGYVSTQDLLTLELECRAGNRPDVAIFYNGFNDIASALQNAAAGVAINEINRSREFNQLYRSDTGDLWLALLRRQPLFKLFAPPAPGNFIEAPGIENRWAAFFQAKFADPRIRARIDAELRKLAPTTSGKRPRS